VRMRKTQNEKPLARWRDKRGGESEKKLLDTKYVEKVAEPAVDGRSWTHTRQCCRYIILGI